MQLTKHTDYAFRTLMYLGSMESELATISVISERVGMSKSHLMKIVNRMVNLGWLEAIRGKHGGVRLAVAPDQLKLDTVIREMEQTLSPVNCHAPSCALLSVCRLKGVMWEAQQAFLTSLSRYTLLDLIDQPTILLVNKTL